MNEIIRLQCMKLIKCLNDLTASNGSTLEIYEEIWLTSLSWGDSLSPSSKAGRDDTRLDALDDAREALDVRLDTLATGDCSSLTPSLAK